ncbi:sulfotransferase family protein [Rhodospira trueperi]|uniref:Sulfotransferase n=1 Tax=Rhodospira trueperi TaxID=69960 RepID=A0A1G7FF63_9PROT|nr:sulfotransferase [Rhodospira trueperi]SDE74477.1 sulfotransferase [Rhodospira trueperi]
MPDPDVTRHFISGLPRSGSTLLAALLRQNPRFHASMSSGLHALVAANLQIMSAGSETSLLMSPEQRPRILRALFESYYAGLTDRPVIFDTNRAWCARLPLIADLFPKARVIACVRDVSWVLDSLERLIRRDPYENTRLFGGDGGGATVYSRVETLTRPNRLVGYPWAALKEAFYGEQAERLLVVDYEYLCRAPEQVLRLIYGFLDEPWSDSHDFEHVAFDAPAFDEALGLRGLHRVKPRVAFEERRTILPPDLFKKYRDMDFWHDVTGSRANVIAAQRGGAPVRPVSQSTG